MNKQQLQDRTKDFAIRVVKASQALPHDRTGDALGSQFLRSGTSVGANYRAACRAKSTADFINKLKIVEEECDEAMFWMEVITGCGLMPESKLEPLHREAGELLAITVSAIRTTRANRSS